MATYLLSVSASVDWFLFDCGLHQPWDFFGRNDAKAETPVLWPPHAKSWLIGKDSDARRDWGQEEKGTTEDEMAGWHHGLDGRESEWTPGDGDGQGGLACCHSWGRKESEMTERLNWTDLMGYIFLFILIFCNFGLYIGYCRWFFIDPKFCYLPLKSIMCCSNY